MQRRLNRYEVAILKMLQKAKDPLKRMEIMEKTNMTEQRSPMHIAFGRLESDELIRTVPNGKGLEITSEGKQVEFSEEES